jgi:rhodanese-related sulfurtransferase
VCDSLSEEENAMIVTISRDDLKKKIDAGEDFVLAEILPEDAYAKGHLRGAVNMPGARVAELAPALIPDKSSDVVVYCGSPL